MEQANGVLKGILARTILENREKPLPELLTRAVSIYNRRVSPSGYSPFFLLFGTQPPEAESLYPPYVREATPMEEHKWAEELTNLNPAPIARAYVNSMKSARAKTRA